MSQAPESDPLAFLAGGGDMGARIREYDWSKSPLGPPSEWPQALRTSLRVLLTTNHPIFVFWGPELICFYNDAYCQSLGPEKHPAILGARGREAWDEIWDIIGPQIDQVMAGRGATWHENQLVPITRHGRREDVYWTYSYGPIDYEHAPSGVGGVLVICTETTRQVLAEARLRASNAELRLIADTMPGLISFVDDTERYRFVNRRYQEWFGHTPEETIGRTLTEVLGESAYLAIQPQVRRALAGEVVSYEAAVPYRDGGTRFIHAEYVPVVTAGKVKGFYAFVQDMSLRKSAEETLREADRRKDEFLAMLAHELRNPLAPIRTAAQVLKLSTSADPHALRTSEIIVRQVEHMTEIVDDLLDVSRVTRGLVELNLEVVDVKQAVAAAVEQIRPALETRRQRLTLDAPPDLVQVRGDAVRLAQIVGNLLTNAVKYTPDDGAITLTMQADTANVLIAVSDTGVGIAADLLPRIFDLFAQGDRSAARSQGGLGLGLALVKRLVELHGGVVEASSAGPGQGSEFTVRLPRIHAAAEAATAAECPGDAAQRRESPSLRLMVVDDNKDAADMLAMLLRMEGHEVSVEHDAQSALTRALSERPPVMLLDIGLPTMDGFELARRLRANPDTSSSTLIALTGYGRDDDRVRSREAGFDHHLVKPVDPRELTTLLSGITERSRQA